MLQGILQRLSPAQKSKLRGWYFNGKAAVIKRFRSYGPEGLKQRLAAMGLRQGDTLLVHCTFGRFLGFQGSPKALIDAFLEAIGPNGNLLMVSMAYMSSTSDYLRGAQVFDVRKTASKMGLISETFRRMPGVVRSLNPSHPLLAFGPQAEWIVDGHERCLYSCGRGSPFEKLLELNGKVLFFGVSEFFFTFHHYLEDMIKDQLSFPLYETQPLEMNVIDAAGATRSVTTYAFTKEAISRRRVHKLFDELTRQGKMVRARIGNTPMVMLATADSVACTKALAAQGVYFYEMA
jgi:aminoglycoside 3-N-acetyltransferase